MSTPATIADVVRLLAVNDLRDAHRLALRAHGELKRTGATDDLLADVGQAAYHLGSALRAIAKADRPPEERHAKPKFRPLTDAEKRECAEARILERLRHGAEKTVPLARYAGRNAIGYDVARRVMDNLAARGVLRMTDDGGRSGWTWTLITEANA